MNDRERMHAIDVQFSHVWMVRTFLKHSDEVEEDQELARLHRVLYDVMLAVGPALSSGDAATYLKQTNKKIGRLHHATVQFRELQPEISTHTNFQMDVQSLTAAVAEVRRLLDQGTTHGR